jgi:hypothetical protein
MACVITVGDLVQVHSDGTRAVDGISFSVSEGEFFGFLKSSGAVASGGLLAGSLARDFILSDGPSISHSLMFVGDRPLLPDLHFFAAVNYPG